MIQDLKGWELMKPLDYPRRLVVQFMSGTADDDDEETATTKMIEGEGEDNKVEQETEETTMMDNEKTAKSEGERH